MLGDAMMRAGATETAMAERKRITPMSFNKYKTPTRDNVGYEWSLGILNMTEEEVSIVAEFATRLSQSRSDPRVEQRKREAAKAMQDMQAQRGTPAMDAAQRLEAMMAGVNAGTISKMTLMDEIRRTSGVGYDVEKRAALLTNIMEDERDERRKYLTGGFVDPIEEAKAEPEVKGNRFSGLDIE